MDQITIPRSDWVKMHELCEALSEKEELYRVALSHTNHQVLMLDIPQKVLSCIGGESPYFRDSEYMVDVPTSIFLTGFIHVEDQGLLEEFFSEIYEGAHAVECTVRVRVADDSAQWQWFSFHSRSILTEGDRPLKAVVFVDDITSYMEMREQYFQYRSEVERDMSDHNLERKRLREEAELDPLCGLYNRKAFEIRVNSVLENDRRTSAGHLFMIDVDNFKDINDEYGHVLGDEVIRGVAAAMRKCFRESDILGRMGGDEFVAFVGNISSDQAKKRAEEVGMHLTQTQYSQSTTHPVTLSIGIAETKGYEGFTSLYSKADKALYRAKANGKAGWSIWE